MTRKQTFLPLEYPPDFLVFWKAYPPQKSNGVWLKPGKAEAFDVWRQMSDAQKTHAMYSVTKYKPTVKDGSFVCHARTWLNRRRYEDWDMPEEEGQHLPENLTNVFKTIGKPEKPNEARNRINKELRVKP